MLLHQCKALSPLVAGSCIEACTWVGANGAIQAKISTGLWVSSNPAGKRQGEVFKMKTITDFLQALEDEDGQKRWWQKRLG